jgi:hypothetical protein
MYTITWRPSSLLSADRNGISLSMGKGIREDVIIHCRNLISKYKKAEEAPELISAGSISQDSTFKRILSKVLTFATIQQAENPPKYEKHWVRQPWHVPRFDSLYCSAR